jgi:hypothetical protein
MECEGRTHAEIIDEAYAEYNHAVDEMKKLDREIEQLQHEREDLAKWRRTCVLALRELGEDE